MDKDYEIVMGLEVHVELKTNTKIFCNCSTEFGGEPNSHCCPVCLGLPGSLPVLNGKVVEYAVKAGLATNCEITRLGRQDRKHYFYPDLGKAYQISQDSLPICHHGHLDIEVEGGKKTIGITRIHIEEDAGKLVHKEGVGTLIDNNRSGMPLTEIVSEPDLRSKEEVIAYLQKLRAILRYIDVSDCKMNEGSMRADVNLSIRKKGQKEFGVRAEMKNLNSFQSIMRAIDYESERQFKAIKAGEKLVQETRRFDQNTGKTYSMREKEDAHDYRYLPDPDLMKIRIEEEFIEDLKNSLPELPDARKEKYMDEYALSSYDAEQLISSIELADYFERAAKLSNDTKVLANLLISEVFRLVSADNFDVPFSPESLSELVNFIDSGRVSISAGKKIVEKMFKEEKSPDDIIKEYDLEQINDEKILSPIVDEAIAASKKAVEQYKGGKEKALQSIVGKVMGKTKGKANPRLTIELLKKKIEE